MLVTLPGQKLGKHDVVGGILVKPARGKEYAFAKAKKAASEGDFFYTTSLKQNSTCYCAADIRPVRRFFEYDMLDHTDMEVSLTWERWLCGSEPRSVFCGIEPAELLKVFCRTTHLQYERLDFGYYAKRGVVASDDDILVDGMRVSQMTIGKDEAVLHLSDGETRKDLAFVDIPDDDQYRLYHAVVTIALHLLFHPQDIVTGGDWLEIDGKLHVPVCWPFVQELFDKKGFRRHSVLINEEPYYERYGDSAYWVESDWYLRNV